jgi:hypothetical protein
MKPVMGKNAQNKKAPSGCNSEKKNLFHFVVLSAFCHCNNNIKDASIEVEKKNFFYSFAFIKILLSAFRGWLVEVKIKIVSGVRRTEMNLDIKTIQSERWKKKEKKNCFGENRKFLVEWSQSKNVLKYLLLSLMAKRRKFALRERKNFLLSFSCGEKIPSENFFSF